MGIFDGMIKSMAVTSFEMEAKEARYAKQHDDMDSYRKHSDKALLAYAAYTGIADKGTAYDIKKKMNDRQMEDFEKRLEIGRL